MALIRSLLFVLLFVSVACAQSGPRGGVSGETGIPSAGGGGGGGGVSALSITRAQIPTSNTGGAANLILIGYNSANDLGWGAPYTCRGQSSTSWNAIKDRQGTWCALNLVAARNTGGLYPGWFGAKGDDGATTISSGDIAAHPEWRGTYTAGLSWDYVGIQEEVYAAWATTSTPSTIRWNTVTGKTALNIIFNLNYGVFGVNHRITANMQGGVFRGAKNQTILDWTGGGFNGSVTGNDYIWYCDGCSYSIFTGLTTSKNSPQSFGSAVANVAFDYSGRIGSLNTQQNTFIDMQCGVRVNGGCFDLQPNNGSQGDTNTFINPNFTGSDGAYAINSHGCNSMNNAIFGGDIQGFPGVAIINNCGQWSIYNVHDEDEGNGSSPIKTQFTLYGAAYQIVQACDCAQMDVISAYRSEAEVIALGYSGAGAFLGDRGLTIQGAATTGSADIRTWAANAFFQEGNVVGGGSDNRVFMLVDGGGVYWKSLTSFDTNAHTLTDTGASYTTNQWANYNLVIRYDSTGAWHRCVILSNTATVITYDPNNCGGAGAPPNVGQQTYAIIGFSGGSTPSWNSAAIGTQAAFTANGFGFDLASGSTCVHSPNGGSIGDYIAVPNGQLVGTLGGAIGGVYHKTIFTAKITATGACGGGTPPNGNVTVNRTPNRTISQGPGYLATPISDGTLGYKWIDLPFISMGPANSMTDVVMGQGAIEIGGAMMNVSTTAVTNSSSPIYNGFDSTMMLNTGQPTPTTGAAFVAISKGAYRPIQCTPFSGSGTLDLTARANTCNSMQLVPTAALTINFPKMDLYQGQEFVFHIIASGGPFTITCGTNSVCNSPFNTGSATAHYDWVFRYEGSRGFANGAAGKWIETSRSPNSPPFFYSAGGTALPSCGSGNSGQALTVSDATGPTYNATYVSGGAVVSPVVCDGTNWKTH
jgi:hypothetical protein